MFDLWYVVYKSIFSNVLRDIFSRDFWVISHSLSRSINIETRDVYGHAFALPRSSKVPEIKTKILSQRLVISPRVPLHKYNKQQNA